MRDIIIVLFIILIPVFIIVNINYYNSEQTITAKVIDKERISQGSGENLHHTYLIHTDKEVFSNEDVMLRGKFNSSDIQGQLHVDSTYTFKVLGWRIPVLSMYRNIVEYKPTQK